MINKYREDQSRRLTFTEARTLLAGDVNGILRVWTFLDSWGLINFSAKERPPADNLGPAAPFQLAPSGAACSQLSKSTAQHVPGMLLVMEPIFHMSWH